MSKSEGQGVICANVVNAVHSGRGGGRWNAIIMTFRLGSGESVTELPVTDSAVVRR
jgi:hypothetical protein